jgi:hypothetical protein
MQSLTVSYSWTSAPNSKVNPKSKMDICNLTEGNKTTRFTFFYFADLHSLDFTKLYAPGNRRGCSCSRIEPRLSHPNEVLSRAGGGASRRGVGSIECHGE